MKKELNESIRAIRKSLGMTQDQFANELGIKRSLVGAYEEGRAEPRLELICKIAALGNVSVEDLLGVVSYDNIIKVNKGNVRPIEEDLYKPKNTIELVPVKAAAGYLNGYSDPEFIQELPRFSLPILNSGTYRAFEISGDSMLPLESGTIIVGEHVATLSEIKSGKTYVLVTKSEGVVYKRVFNYVDENGKLFLVSDNRQYAPYQIDAMEVMEIWSAKAFISLNFPE
ncbi:MAG: LexA family transcriptional regulator [Bacteroidetes bacterium]|nr:LexA family transcriptional regulator [Bacteroidota bacterium]